MHRLQLEIRDEDMLPLRDLAFKEHRSVRDHGSWLLHLKIQEEIARPREAEESDVAEVA